MVENRIRTGLVHLAIIESYRHTMDRGPAFSVGIFTIVLHAFFSRAASHHRHWDRRVRVWASRARAANCWDDRGNDRATERRSRLGDDSKCEQPTEGRNDFSSRGHCYSNSRRRRRRQFRVNNDQPRSNGSAEVCDRGEDDSRGKRR